MKKATKASKPAKEEKIAVKEEKIAEKADKAENTCKHSSMKIWCISVMTVAILILTWFEGIWPRVIITILAIMILIRSMMVNCCK